ncbi:polysaccharide lyase [Aureimonas sp. SA4125]|uniref:pectate lyase n=1 Tax=Aureimonas sp. SA4125 TaxID=2826993 RepID=UPI001CC517EB|nr:pectate lyase [Aureimonas sp. SA4125]BDA82960.1 polysaccharide lyase [Aureimonas sp. SA4125]
MGTRSAIRGVAAAVLLSASVGAGMAQGKPAPSTARETLEKAGAYFRDHLGVGGTYVWKYGVDGNIRRGEGGEVSPTLGWVQPPGTPAVGAAFLRIYDVTGDTQWLDAARIVARALVRTQLLSGGWFQAIETDPERSQRWCYRLEIAAGQRCKEGEPDRNKSILDDNNTQSVMNFLMWFDRAAGATEPDVRAAIDYGLKRLMAAQYRNGAFPAAYSEKAPGAEQDVAPRASLPAEWPRVWQKPDSPPYFITNDNLQRDMGRLFLNAFRTYRNPAYLQTAMKIGDFLVAAQLPAPQQGWAQTYDQSLQPVWGRKFEPPALASSETAGNIEYLVELHEQTSKARYLETAAAAAEWLDSVRLPDGPWARFYELRSDRPLYVDPDYKITYDDQKLPDHYTLRSDFGIPRVFDRLRTSRRGGNPAPTGFWVNRADAMDREELAAEAQRLSDQLDGEGRWVDAGWIDGAAFVDGVFVLARLMTLSSEADN